MGKRSLSGVAVVVATLVVANAAHEFVGTLAQLRASVPPARYAAAAAEPLDRAPARRTDSAGVDARAAVPADGAGVGTATPADAVDAAGVDVVPLPAAANTSDDLEAPTSRGRPGAFDSDAALRIAIDLDPEIGELVNDADPAVRSALASFFADEDDE